MRRVALAEVRECEWLAAAGEVHRGRVKQTNQDRVLVWGPGVPVVDRAGGGYLFGVVDGRGGGKRGDLAADHVVAALLEYYTQSGASGPDRVEALLHEANRRICAEQLVARDRDTMGCVATCLWANEGRIELLHVGDTRAYGVNHDGIRQLTEDNRDRAGIVTNWMGAPHELTIARRSLDPEDWDYLLVCSDGVTLELCDQRLLEIVRTRGEPAGIVQATLAAALNEQGRDNLTVVCVELY